MSSTYIKGNIFCYFCKDKIEGVRRTARVCKGKEKRYKRQFCNASCEMKYMRQHKIINQDKDKNPKFKNIPKKEFIKMYYDFVKIKDIANHFKVEASTIKRRIKWWELKRNKIKNGSIILNEFLRGATIRSLCKKYKVGRDKIVNILDKNNIPTSLNWYNHKLGDGKADNFVRKEISNYGFRNVDCRNLCLKTKKVNQKPFNICKICPIKEHYLKEISYFDLVLFKDNKFYIGEVKSSDRFTFNQTKNLLYLYSKGINIILIKTRKGEKIEKIEIFEKNKI